MIYCRPLIAAVMLTVTAAACVRPAPADTAAHRPHAALNIQARAFMDAYARDLLRGDRAAIARRYHRDGAFILGNGQKVFESYPKIAAHYAGDGWSPPVGFEWRDLSFEIAGPDAVVVAGKFIWKSPSEPSAIFSYTGLLLRQDGELRIRLEDESSAPTKRKVGTD